jgi:gliding motility-associated-like protein
VEFENLKTIRVLKQNLIMFFFVLIGAIPALRAQTLGNLEFIENKGQWDSAVRFRAEMPNTIFFLQKHGFSVLLQSPADMNALRNAMHGIPHSNTAASKKTVYPTIGKSGNTSTLAATLPPSDFQPNKPGEGNEQDTSTGILMHSHFYQVEFLNSSEQVEITGDKGLDTYNNYFIGNEPSKWRSGCKIYQAVVYKNIYPNIDLRYYTENDQLKYDLVVHPGGNPDNIILKYKGADKFIVKRGQITVHTSVGDVKETIPRTYQFSKEGNKDLECSYIAGPDNTVRFSVSNYSPSATLIIDPTLIFSSFTGSRSDNWGYTATYDESGNFYSGSITLNSIQNDAGNGFPVTTGAYQTKFLGGDNSDGGYEYDITIMKFSSNGRNRLYATYLGGSGNEQPHSLVADAAGNLVIAGRTSSPNFPSVNNGGPNDVLKGGYDIILAKLNPGGTALIGSRIIGGTANDGVNISPKYSTSPIPMGQNSLRLNYGDDGRSEVIMDKSGNIYLASCTSSNNFPVSANAFQKISGGKQDAVLIKTSPDLGTILVSTYIGGSNDDAAFALALDPNSNNIFVVGGTASNNLPGTGNGPVVSSVNKGGIDGFLSIVSNNGGTLIKTSYFGTTGTEVLYGVQFDNKGYPYIMGTTTGAWPVINATFSQANGKQFIAKLKPDISAYIYSTVFGKGSAFPDISPTAFLVDRCENVYVAGWGGGIEVEGRGSVVYNNSKTTGLTTTANALKKTTDGNDFYFFVMKKDAVSQLFGSFFGQTGGLGNHVDGGTSRFDKQGIIYQAICANCYGMGSFPTTLNVWSAKNGTGANGCNLAAVKIALNFAGVGADPRSLINGRYDSSGCVPLDVLFKDTVHNAKTYVWNFGDGTPDTTTTSFEVLHTYQFIGNFTVRLIAIDSTTCNISDTAYLRIRVRTDKAILNFDINKLPPCQSLNYLFTNISTPPAGKPFQAGSFTWNFGDGTTSPGLSPVQHSYLSSGTYIIQLILSDTNYCNYPDTASQTLRVSPVVKAQFEIADGCAPYDAIFNNTSLAGQSFFWDFGDGSTSTDINPVHNYIDTGTYLISLLAIDSNTCNVRDSTTRSVRVNPKPTADFTTQPVPPVYNTPNIFTNNSTGATHYVWHFGDGDSTLKNSLDTVIHQYQETNTFNACLVAINQFGCADTVCHPVETLINPLLDVPNAFTPGRFGQNSVVMVKGFGIATMVWKIYNRWGQLVFESNNPFIGWDGTYNGTLQPIGVYAYTLDAIFFDGTKTRRKGDITLIR